MRAVLCCVLPWSSTPQELGVEDEEEEEVVKEKEKEKKKGWRTELVPAGSGGHQCFSATV